MIRRFLRDESGATAIEYALIATLISIMIVGGATLIGGNLRLTFNQLAANLSSR